MIANDIIFQNALAVTASDANDLAHVCYGLVATTAGVASVITEGGTTVIVPVGTQPIYLSVTRVRATGTTATGIVGLY